MLNYFLPHVCIFCGAKTKRDLSLCFECEMELPYINHCCHYCAYPIAESQNICEKCLNKRPPFDSTISLFKYEKPITKMVMNLKFHGELIYAHIFAKLLAKKIAGLSPKPELIIPVPLHASRLRKRGFNQALEIAKPIAKEFAIPLDFSSVSREKNTAMQAQLQKKFRRENIKNAFMVRKKIETKHVAIIDDVITTGSTISELCRTLKKSGVKTIDVFSIARTP